MPPPGSAVTGPTFPLSHHGIANLFLSCSPFFAGTLGLFALLTNDLLHVLRTRARCIGYSSGAHRDLFSERLLFAAAGGGTIAVASTTT